MRAEESAITCPECGMPVRHVHLVRIVRWGRRRDAWMCDECMEKMRGGAHVSERQDGTTGNPGAGSD